MVYDMLEVITMKKWISICTIALFLILTNHSLTYAKNETLSLAADAKSAILIERDTGEILYNKNEHERLAPASMTKVMTLLLVMEAIEKEQIALDDIVTVSEQAASMGGSQVFLAAGEEISIEDLIKSVAIASGNDASVALAETIAGTEEAFVDLMNKKAQQLQLKNTNFKNTSGLPAKDHYSTAYDTAMIAKALLTYESITHYTSIYEDYLRKGEENEFWLVNTNKLVHFYPYVDGLKTGYTSEAKYCLVATAKRDNMRVISVVMGAETVKERNAMIMNMIDYAHSQYETEKLYDKGETVGKITNLQSEQMHYPVKTSEDISYLHKKSAAEKTDITTEIKMNEQIPLPLDKGTEVGTITIKQDNQVVTESPLVIEEDIKRASFTTLYKRVWQHVVKYKTSSKKNNI